MEKQSLENCIKKEETLINKYRLELEEYEKLLIDQKEKIDGLSYILNDYENIDKDNNDNNEKKDNNKDINDSIYNSDNNMDMSNAIVQSDNNIISNIKNEIFEINSKIQSFKKNYIYNLFEEIFINKKDIIKISDFFYDQENNINLSFINISNKNEYDNSESDNMINQNDNLIGKAININILKKNDLFFQRFNSFFKSMIIFLEKAYKKFKLTMPFKISHFKI